MKRGGVSLAGLLPFCWGTPMHAAGSSGVTSALACLHLQPLIGSGADEVQPVCRTKSLEPD